MKWGCPSDGTRISPSGPRSCGFRVERSSNGGCCSLPGNGGVVETSGSTGASNEASEGAVSRGEQDAAPSQDRKRAHYQPPQHHPVIVSRPAEALLPPHFRPVFIPATLPEWSLALRGPGGRAEYQGGVGTCCPLTARGMLTT